MGLVIPVDGEKLPQGHNHFSINSNSQREYIMGQAKERKLPNLTVITADVNTFEPEDSYDRVVSVEMFEHVRNHRGLFKRIHSWLKKGGKLFTHVFCHRSTSYPFEVEGEDDWMSSISSVVAPCRRMNYFSESADNWNLKQGGVGQVNITPKHPSAGWKISIGLNLKSYPFLRRK